MTPPPTAAANLDEIRAILSHLPGPDEAAAAAAVRQEGTLTKPAGALGRLEDISAWAARWQGRHPPRLDHPRVAVFAGNHGVAAARQVSAFPTSVTAQMVANFSTGGAAVNQLCRIADSDLRVYEMALDRPTADFTTGPAMSDEDCARAMSYGMMACQQGLDLLCLGEMGIGNTTVASALCAGLFGGAAADWVGPGTGVDAAGRDRKIAAVEAALAANAAALSDPLEVLRSLGGQELAAIAGAVLAARMGRVPVLLDGFATTAAAAILWRLDATALDHCLIAHRSAEPGHRRLLAAIGREPLFDLGMRLGEASGAALAIPVVRAAIACHTGMASFGSAGVDGRVGAESGIEAPTRPIC